VKESLTELSELMMPTHVNNLGSVFGGVILQLMDKAAYVSAARHAGVPCVTASFDRVDFVSPIRVGELVTLRSAVHFAGKSSMEVGVVVTAEDFLSGQKREAFRGRCTMVALGSNGKPAQVPRVRPETEPEKTLYAQAEKRYRERQRH
jgi:acyl-CoA hydrolase